MYKKQIIGMIDIGSNTVRLAVYQITENGAFRVIDQGRWPARLSQKLTAGGELPRESVDELAEVLLHFKRICRMHRTTRIKAVATAAIRQAANREQALARLTEVTGLTIELLSGEDEARFGSLAMLRTMDVEDGFVVDIGGGSTEITLLRDRKIVSSVSFPFGCVNTSRRFGMKDEPVPPAVMERAVSELAAQLRSEPWIRSHPGLPLIGLGGTLRSFAKISQRSIDYPLSNLHGYEFPPLALENALQTLAPLGVEKRRKVPGLSKDRADVIVPGLLILQAVVQACQASRVVVCGAGLRDGIFFDACLPAEEVFLSSRQVLEDSIRNLSALYPTVPQAHLEQVNRLALSLYDSLAPEASLPPSSRVLLDAASRLFRIGSMIDVGDNADHTFYILMHAHWNGLGHREMLLTAAIASYKGPGAMRSRLVPYKALLREGDFERISKLGMLLQLAAALDRSESQGIASLDITVERSRQLTLSAAANHPLHVEMMEVETLAKDFKKSWGLSPVLSVSTLAPPPR
ncbi:Ppx/GppA phosphatase family protein [Cohnella fermenti]|uniref:Ppx/GppA phosphatase family protein n=1 Tax=Cohnella fermenti TaxID=2565925 RepID=UPI001E2A0880|nr:Ppx/GppA phosphatase family protein [Cohnella fermenti]